MMTSWQKRFLYYWSGMPWRSRDVTVRGQIAPTLLYFIMICITGVLPMFLGCTNALEQLNCIGKLNLRKKVTYAAFSMDPENAITC